MRGFANDNVVDAAVQLRISAFQRDGAGGAKAVLASASFCTLEYCISLLRAGSRCFLDVIACAVPTIRGRSTDACRNCRSRIRWVGRSDRIAPSWLERARAREGS